MESLCADIAVALFALMKQAQTPEGDIKDSEALANFANALAELASILLPVDLPTGKWRVRYIYKKQDLNTETVKEWPGTEIVEADDRADAIKVFKASKRQSLNEWYEVIDAEEIDAGSEPLL